MCQVMSVAMTVKAMVVAVAVVAALASALVHPKIVIVDVVIHVLKTGERREATIDPREGGVEVTPHHHRRHRHRPLLPA